MWIDLQNEMTINICNVMVVLWIFMTDRQTPVFTTSLLLDLFLFVHMSSTESGINIFYFPVDS